VRFRYAHHVSSEVCRLHGNSFRLALLTMGAARIGVDGELNRSPMPRRNVRRWSARVTKTSDALDLTQGVFALNDPKRIARSLKRSAERSRRKKAEAYRSALSMLSFYINRAGKNLPASRRKKLEQAKIELRKQFGRGRTAARRRATSAKN
jgi:Protein of unknown function (DUF3175)